VLVLEFSYSSMVLDVLIFGTAAQIPANSGRKIWEEMDFVGFVKKGRNPAEIRYIAIGLLLLMSLLSERHDPKQVITWSPAVAEK